MSAGILIRAVRVFRYRGEVVQPGAVVACDSLSADAIVGTGRAAYVDDATTVQRIVIAAIRAHNQAVVGPVSRHSPGTVFAFKSRS